MTRYTSAGGGTFSDQDIEAWAAQTESGYDGGHRGPATPGRPISIGAEARPFTLRLDAARRTKLNGIARQRNTTASQLVRDLIDSL